jgi:hypothetical protein
MKAPSTNIQAPEKHKTPNFKPKSERAAFSVGAWSLKFLWSLELGIWSFVSC